MLADEQLYSVAVGEFMWHVHELALEVTSGELPGANSNLAEVVNQLERRAKRLGSPDLLLAQCLLHRFSFARITGARVVTTKAETLPILQNTGIAPDSSERAQEAVAGQVAVSIFDELLHPFVPPLDRMGATVLRKLVDERNEPLTVLRAKCVAIGEEIASSAPRPEQLPGMIRARLAQLQSDVQAALEIDRSKLAELVKKLATDEKIWITVATLAGSMTGLLPPVVAAAAAITCLSIVGSSALRAGFDRRKSLAESPWSFIYYLREYGK
jgi:hypothetical protein